MLICSAVIGENIASNTVELTPQLAVNQWIGNASTWSTVYVH